MVPLTFTENRTILSDIKKVAHSIVADPKPGPNRGLYLKTLRAMTPEARLAKALELSGISRDLFAAGLRRRFPHLGEEDFRKLLVDRLARCHNSNY